MGREVRSSGELEGTLALSVRCSEVLRAPRRNATLCPRAIRRKPYDEMAKEAGFDDVWEFMSSPHNSKMSQYFRTSSDSCVADRAAACIVVPTEIAHKFNAKPVEVLGTGASVLDAIVPHLEKKAAAEAARQVFEMTGLTADDMDLVFVNDFIGSSAFLAAEEISYLPKGEG